MPKQQPALDSLHYVDALIKEYLLFRGFTRTLAILHADLAADRGCGFQADQISEMVFRRLIPQHDHATLMELLEFLNSRVYCRLDASYEPTIRKLEVSILRCLLVHAVQAGKLDVVRNFLAAHAELLLGGAEAAEWHVWFALPYCSNPAGDQRFAVFFSHDWALLLEASFRNFLAEVIDKLPLPAILRFNADRLQRQGLQKRVDQLQAQTGQLQAQNAQLQQQMAALLEQNAQQAAEGPQVNALEQQRQAAHSGAADQSAQQPPSGLAAAAAAAGSSSSTSPEIVVKRQDAGRRQAMGSTSGSRSAAKGGRAAPSVPLDLNSLLGPSGSSRRTQPGTRQQPQGNTEACTRATLQPQISSHQLNDLRPGSLGSL